MLTTKIYAQTSNDWQKETLSDIRMRYGTNFELIFTEEGVEIIYEELEISYPNRKKMS